jgi:hypothetical protein
MKIDREATIAELNLIPFGAKGWMNSSETRCPVCGRSDKFGIKFNDQGGGSTHCFYSCGDNISLARYLKMIGKGHLVIYEQQASIQMLLPELFVEHEQVVDEIPEVKLPKGYERIYFDKYLRDRNFKSYQYEQFEVGITEHFLERKLHDYIIFVIKQQGRRVAWMARSKRSKEWHKKNLENYKQGLEPLVLRYKNSPGTDFDRILGGFDEITPSTREIIAVEGLFDKTNISNLLDTRKSDELKVLFTFGNTFSEHQIQLLKTTNVRKVTLMYDPETINQSKRYSVDLSRHFEVDVCHISDPDVDPGNMTREYLDRIYTSKKNFVYFYTSMIPKENIKSKNK